LIHFYKRVKAKNSDIKSIVSWLFEG